MFILRTIRLYADPQGSSKLDLLHEYILNAGNREPVSLALVIDPNHEGTRRCAPDAFRALSVGFFLVDPGKFVANTFLSCSRR